MSRFFAVLFAVHIFHLSLIIAQDQPSCESKIFCQGLLLHTVQMARIFNDSKTFVDMKIRTSEDEVLANFDEFMKTTNNDPSRSQVRDFVDKNFEQFDEFEDWSPSDFTPEPKLISKITDPEIKEFAKNLVNIWPELARKITPIVKEKPELFSLISVDNGFIIPGGRFREFYYWDSYWITKGLLLSDMHDTVKGMLENFLSLVNRIGFIPNGNRIYYLNRSQPPLLTPMVMSYIKATNDIDFLKQHIQTLDKELMFWLQNKVLEVTKDNIKYTLAHYDSESGSPRPESYREDINTANYFADEDRRKQVYADIKSAAESGIDFSTRWIVDSDGGNSGNLSLLQTRRIVPVDLNSFLCSAFKDISDFYFILKDDQKTVFWDEKYQTWLKTIDQVLYNFEDGIWYDFDVELQQHRKFFFPSNLAPLWAEAYNPALSGVLGQRAAKYLKDLQLLEYKGGIPASLDGSGEQWDFPNAWPPFQSIVILGLKQSGDCDAKKLAKKFAKNWVDANLIGYKNTEEMFEKYDAVVPGKYGGGGEYTIQSGFGWTNGVVLELIDTYYTEGNNYGRCLG